MREPKCPWLGLELTIPLIEKEQWPIGGNHHQVLFTVVVDVREERARGVVQHAHARRLRNVLERSVATIVARGKKRRP
ncbi:MAG TPA: hypothetical protein VGW37_19390 [Terriglobia bacterium]|nr:hypothetical protein [Terriglobia bacterium]